MASVACSVCGVLSVANARYCHECGTRLDIEVVDLSGRSPEPTAPPPAPASTEQRLAVALGAIALVALVWFALFGGSSDTPEDDDQAAAPTATPRATESAPPTPRAEFQEGPGASIPASVFSSGPTGPSPPFVAEPATIAGSLRWQQANLGPDGWPIGLVDWGEQVLLFTTLADTPSFEPFGRGMAGWVSDDGATWQPLGTVIDELQSVHQVQAAAGFLLASGSNSEGQPSVWTSADGVNWTSATLPGTERLPTPTRLFTEAIGGNDRRRGRRWHPAYRGERRRPRAARTARSAPRRRACLELFGWIVTGGSRCFMANRSAACPRFQPASS